MKKLSGIYSICDTSLSPGKTHFKLAEKLLEGGVPILQLRMKGEKDLTKVRETTQAILSLKQKYSFTFIVNDFVEIGLELEADGIHLGKDDLSIPEARKLVGPDILIGYSSHSFEEAVEAEKLGADYVALGAIFPTKTKGPGHPVVGVETLSQVVQKLKVPTVAIGGIDRSNFSQVVSTGVDAIAMISALTLAEDIPKAVGWFKKEWKKLS